MQLDPLFTSNIRGIYGEEGDVWLQGLEARIEALSSLWQFRFLRPMADLSYNFVGLVERKAPLKLAVLKMAPQSSPLKREIQWLTGVTKGTPEVYAKEEKLNAFLMEYLEPGYSLKKLVQEGDDDTATRIICQTIRTIHSQQPGKSGFPHLADCLKDFSFLHGHFNHKLLGQAESWFKDLTLERADDVLLHGDLHHDNILSCGTSWKAIDPHGYIGDPVAEVGVLFRNPVGCFPSHHPLSQVIDRRLRIMGEELPFDSQKIRQWAFCLTVLSAAWSLEDRGEVPALEAAVADALFSL